LRNKCKKQMFIRDSVIGHSMKKNMERIMSAIKEEGVDSQLTT